MSWKTSISATAATFLARVLAGGLGLFAAAVGAHDALRASVLADRLTGTAFALAGALLLAAALASRRPRSSGEGEDWRLLLGVAAGLVGMGVGAFLLLAALEDPAARSPRWLLPWAAVICAGGFITGVYLVVGRGRIRRTAKGSLSLVASGVAATVLVGMVQLWHESASKTSRDNPNVVLEARVTPAEDVGALQAYEVEFRARNLSDVPVVIVGSRYSATGYWLEKLPPAERTDEAFGNRLRGAKWSVHRAAGVRDVEFVHGGPLLPDNYILFPDERYVSRRVIVVEPGRYDELDVSGYAYVARHDRLSVEIPSVPESTPQRLSSGTLSQTALNGSVERLPIEEVSLIGRLTAPARDLLRVRIVDAEGDYEDLVAYVDVRGREGTRPLSQDDADESLERYGFTVATTLNEIFVGPSTESPETAPHWDVYEDADEARLDAVIPTAEWDGRIRFRGDAWVLGHGGGGGVYVGRPGTGDEISGKWKNGDPCPEAVPDAVMQLMGFRDPQVGTCSAPQATPDGTNYFDASIDLDDGSWPRSEGSPEWMLSPWAAALRMHPGDARARERAQELLAEHGFVGGVCAERTDPVRVRSCRLRFADAAGLPSAANAEWAAARWLAIRENLLIEVAEATPADPDSHMVLATTNGGTEAVISSTDQSDAVLVVAGPAEADDAQRHAERAAASVSRADDDR